MKKLSPSSRIPLLKLLAMPLAIGAWWLCADSWPFWREAIGAAGSEAGTGTEVLPEAWLFLFCLYAGVIALVQALLGGRALRWVLAVLSVIGAGGFAFSVMYNAVMSPDMLRNALATDAHEALDLMSPALFGWFLFAAVPPCLFLAKFKAGAVRGLRARLQSALAGLLFLIAGGAVLFAFSQDLSFYMRAHREARYLLSPANVVYSAIRTQAHDKSPDSVKERVPVDPSPALADDGGERPLLIFVVTGETVRAENWGLSGYGRDTTPGLRAENVINYSDATACGTSTDISVPCMHSRVGRRDYDRERILTEEPAAALLQRAGAHVKWVENQSGCKGACAGVPTEKASARLTPALREEICADGLCLDEALLPYAKDPEDVKKRVNVIFMHMSGSHGPAYSKRYRKSFENWGPVCRDVNLSNCDPKELRNAYDNSILYTDRVLAELIRGLRLRTDADTALFYASDHGESLGENGFYLHGAPWAIAPEQQKKIPMVLWMSEGFKARQGISEDCARTRAEKPSSHDNVWSTVLGLAGVRSSAYVPDDDLLAACRGPRK